MLLWYQILFILWVLRKIWHIDKKFLRHFTKINLSERKTNSIYTPLLGYFTSYQCIAQQIFSKSHKRSKKLTVAIRKYIQTRKYQIYYYFDPIFTLLEFSSSSQLNSKTVLQYDCENQKVHY